MRCRQTVIFNFSTATEEDTPWCIFAAAMMAIICQMGAHAVFNICMGHVNSLYVSTWETADPVFCTLIAVVTLGQIPTVNEVVGCVIVVGALLFYNYLESKES